MANQGGTKEYNTFVKGIITEASPLTFPENSSKEDDNFELNTDGTRQRRLGMDFETGAALIGNTDHYFNQTFNPPVPSAIETDAINNYDWYNVANNPFLSMSVVQMSNRLFFGSLHKDPVTGTMYNGGNGLQVPIMGRDPIHFSDINGVLVCTVPRTQPFVIEFAESTGTFTITTLTLEVRDFWGVDDALEVDGRPATLDNLHKYNLLNQGWTTTNIDANFAANATYPSNSDLAVFGKDSSDDFSGELLYKQNFGNTPAPKGHYILNFFARSMSRSVKSTLGGITSDVDYGRPSTSCTYAGRTFYAGMDSNPEGGDSKSPDIGSFVLFSKVATTVEDLGKCYQEADPTSEQISDIIDTDGGFVTIPEAGTIVKLVEGTNSVIVIARNGVWEIFGDTGGFVATSYQVSKITDQGCINPHSVVQVEDVTMFWSISGIIALKTDATSQRLVAEDITATTIKTLYNDDIPETAKTFAKGYYNPTDKKVLWLWNDDTRVALTGFELAGGFYDYTGGLYNRWWYNRELVFDMTLGAWHTRTIGRTIYDIGLSGPDIAGISITPNMVTAVDVCPVLHNGTQVQADTVDVIVSIDYLVVAESKVKYLTMLSGVELEWAYTFSEYKTTNFQDWDSTSFSGTPSGIDAPAYLLTGTETYGASATKKQVPYCYFYFNRTETGFTDEGDNTPAVVGASGCLVQARWDFANHSNSGKYGAQWQAYRLPRTYTVGASVTADTFDQGFEVITTKNKLRGRGKALNLRIDTEPLKDCHILGWTTNITVQTQ